MVLELHRQYVSKVKGYCVLGTAANGEEGLRQVAALKPRLVILDVFMPGLDGLNMLKQLRREGLDTDVIMVTAAHDVEAIQQCIQYGAVDYIIKPFTFQRLRKALLQYQQFRQRVQAGGTLSQHDVDALQGRRDEPGETELPKGLQQATLDTILSLLRRGSGYFTAADIADCLGVSRVTARRYLKYLCEHGCLATILSYGPVGRPLHKYKFNSHNSVL